MDPTNEYTRLSNGEEALLRENQLKGRTPARGKRSQNAGYNYLISNDETALPVHETSACSQDSRFPGGKWSCQAWLGIEEDTGNQETSEIQLAEGSDGLASERFRSQAKGRRSDFNRLPPLRNPNANRKKDDSARAGVLPVVNPAHNYTQSVQHPDGSLVLGRRTSRLTSISGCDLKQGNEKTENTLTEDKRKALDRLKSQIHQKNLEKEKQLTEERSIALRFSSFGASTIGISSLPALKNPGKHELIRKRRHTVCVAPKPEGLFVKQENGFLAAANKFPPKSLIRSLPQKYQSTSDDSNQSELQTSSDEPQNYLPINSTDAELGAMDQAEPISTTVRWLEESPSDPHDVESISAKPISTTVRWLEESPSDPHDVESISAGANHTRRARSDPGDVGTGKSLIAQLLRDTESQTESVRGKVKTFLKKENPARPLSSLRFRSTQQDLELKRFVFKPNQQIIPKRNKIEGVVNVHTCPSLNVYRDRSWVYSDKEGKCRYIRGPATPIPPIEYVFEKDE